MTVSAAVRLSNNKHIQIQSPVGRDHQSIAIASNIKQKEKKTPQTP
jgi:diphthamide synthase subunit DPH2